MSLSILVVDDEESIRNFYEDFFSLRGYKVDSVENGLDGIEKVKKGNYQIVITDVRMPLCDGITLLAKVKELDPAIEVIVMTGYATIETAIKAMKGGAYDFILKPLSLTQIQAVVTRCAEKIELQNKNSELSEANRKLRELNEMKRKFLAITSHEMRTPVCSISGYIDLLEFSLNGEIKDNPGSILAEIRSTLMEFNDIIDEMYDLASADRGGLNIIKEEFDLVDCINLIKKKYLPVIKKRKLNTVFNLQKGVLLFNGDKRRIKQAVKELFENAIKFTPDGGKIEIELFSSENEIKILVKDTGIGIPSDKVKKIFKSFYEVQDSLYHFTSSSDFMGGGLGIGLALVKEIISSHGGSIDVETRINKGSTFIITLPAHVDSLIN